MVTGLEGLPEVGLGGGSAGVVKAGFSVGKGIPGMKGYKGSQHSRSGDSLAQMTEQLEASHSRRASARSHAHASP